MPGKLTVVVDNICYRTGLSGEHGFAVMLETGSGKVMMDSGQGISLGNNLWEMFPGLDGLDALVLSHGHFDHTGGLGALAGFLGTDSEIEASRERLGVVCLHPDVEAPKYSRKGGEFVEIGMTEPVDTYFHPGSIVRTREPFEVSPGVFFLGELPREYPAPVPQDVFFTASPDRTGDLVPDPLLDDSAVVVDSSGGLTVITGCNHSGLRNLALGLKAVFASKPVKTVIGGLHLSSADERRLDDAADALREMGAGEVFVSHCSGVSGYEGLKERLGPGVVRLLTVGDSVEI